GCSSRAWPATGAIPAGGVLRSIMSSSRRSGEETMTPTLVPQQVLVDMVCAPVRRSGPPRSGWAVLMCLWWTGRSPRLPCHAAGQTEATPGSGVIRGGDVYGHCLAVVAVDPGPRVLAGGGCGVAGQH